jgi:8-oxo-dGTP pyrophosphatase MutT (NUDIX family)
VDGRRRRAGGLALSAAADLEALLAHPALARLARSLSERPGAQLALSPPLRRAAVALIIRGAELPAARDGLEVLMIKRADYEGDPWSGHVALPGGRQEPGDASLEATAVRETREETAIDLTTHGRILGRLDELEPRTPVLPPIAIAPYVALLAPGAPMRLSEEVDAAFWVPLERLRDPAAWSDVQLEVRGVRRTFPAFLYEGYVIWGLTERILKQFLLRLDA